MVSAIYVLDPEDGWERLMPVDADDYIRLVEVAGSAQSNLWVPIKVDWVRDKDERGPTDMPVVSRRMLTLGPKAKSHLGDLIAPFGEFLPLADPDGAPSQYVLFNCLNIRDILDTGRSRYITLSNGTISRVQDYTFKDGTTFPEPVCRLPRAHSGEQLVNEAFRDAVHGNRLTGLMFTRVWDDES